MATPAYPSALPLPYSFRLTAADQVLAGDSDGPKDLRRFTLVPGATVDVSFRFLRDQYAVFVKWLKVDLKRGLKWFMLPLPSAAGITPHVVRFKGRPQGSLGGHRYWEVTAEIEIRERLYSISVAQKAFFLEDFESGLGAYTTVSGNPALWNIVPSPFGEFALRMASVSGGGVNHITRPVAVIEFNRLQAKFRITALAADDGGILKLSYLGVDVFVFNVKRENFYDAAGRPFIQVQIGGAFQAVGTTHVVVGTWYQLDVTWFEGARVVIAEVGASIPFADQMITGTIPNPIVDKMHLLDDNSVGSCPTEWDDIYLFNE